MKYSGRAGGPLADVTAYKFTRLANELCDVSERAMLYEYGLA